MRKERIFFYSLVAGILYSSCTKDKGHLITLVPDYCDTISSTFNKDILPIMITHCSNPPFANCHQWATSHSAIKIYINNGSFQDRVLITKNMPPPNNIDNAPPLSDLELKKLNCWIAKGVPNN